MQKGILYNNMDCLDVLETLKDNEFSLIYLDIPSTNIGAHGRRIARNEKSENPVATLCEAKNCKPKDLSYEEIQSFKAECEVLEKRECEKYLYKIIQNCFRVLKDNGVIIYRERVGISKDYSLRMTLENLFCKKSIKVLENRVSFEGFDLIHFFSKGNGISFPDIYEFRPLERFPHEDENGRYRLLSCESARRETNFFEWHGFLPSQGRGWRYSKEQLDDLYKRGLITTEENSEGVNLIRLKEYREAFKVRASSIWNDKNFLERSFDMFASEGDKVLGIYEGFNFSYYAEKKNLSWSSVWYEDTSESYFPGKREMEGKYTQVEELPKRKTRKYNENMPSLSDYLRERQAYFETVIRRYELNERPRLDTDSSTDAILLHYINEYEKQENIGDLEFERRSDVSRQLVSKIRKAVSASIGKKKKTTLIKSTPREKDTILRIAVYTNMMFPETNRALELSGHAFIDGHPVDEAIVMWLCGINRDINELNKLIEINCIEAGLPADEIANYLYVEPVITDKKNTSR